MDCNLQSVIDGLFLGWIARSSRRAVSYTTSRCDQQKRGIKNVGETGKNSSATTGSAGPARKLMYFLPRQPVDRLQVRWPSCYVLKYNINYNLVYIRYISHLVKSIYKRCKLLTSSLVSRAIYVLFSCLEQKPFLLLPNEYLGILFSFFNLCGRAELRKCISEVDYIVSL